MENISEADVNGNTPNSIFLDVKPEPTEIFNLALPPCAACQWSNDVERKFEPLAGEYKNESLAESTITLKDENLVFVPDDTFLKSDAHVDINIKNNVLISNPLSVTKINVEPKFEIIDESTNETNYKCNLCNKSFKMKASLSNHVNVHNDIRNHKCEICARSFKRRQPMLRHVQSHAEKRHYKCDICKTSLKTRNILLNHMKRHIDKTNHQCDVCNKSFKTRRYVVKHMERHTDERNHKCHVCAKSFKTRRCMVKHVQRHSDEKNHKCDICFKSFKTRYNMLYHMRNHVDGKNYRCHVCKKSFKTRRCIIKHMGLHVDEKTHKCDVCNKMFKLRNYLLKHMKLHARTDSKNQINDDCEKMFEMPYVFLSDGDDRKQVLTERCNLNIKEEHWEMDIANGEMENSATMNVDESNCNFFTCKVKPEQTHI